MTHTPAPGRTKAYLNHATRFACLWNRRRSFISTSIILSVAQRGSACRNTLPLAWKEPLAGSERNTSRRGETQIGCSW